MIAFVPQSSGEKTSARKLFAETFRRQIAAIERDRLNWHVPACQHLYEINPGMQYHFKPELFVQLSGSTDFTVRGGSFSLKPGEICVMPMGVPHGEIARHDRKSFENVVVCYYNETVAIHVAHAGAGQHPAVND